MLHAVSFALADSVNVLLIGVLFAIAVMHPQPRRYSPIAAVLVAGDWCGVLLLSLLTLLLFNGIEDVVQTALASPIFGLVLIAIGLLSAFLTLRGGDPSPMINRLAKPLRRASLSTFLSGMVLGLVQSATSAPFFAGLAYLSTVEISTFAKYLTVVLYATLALSLPALSAIALGMVLRKPNSGLAKFIDGLRHRKEQMVALAGYVVAAMLIVLGLLSFL
ncbi:hypothetical protein ACUY2T_07930 [Corynebacterium sp. 22_2729]|uniref:hypothetical protein n=1 Tax=uncultured Corynebacterium sp. TaxID=159447 RepID=UPI0025E99EE0|nr:hypothetical protein [uncultured Corynebacterium sp.]